MNTSSFNQTLVDTIRSYGLLQDRMPGDILSLPYEWTQLKLNANDLILSETINESLTKLHKNWLHLLAYSVIPTNDIPDMQLYADVIMDRGSGIDWVSAENDFASRDSEIKDIKHLIKIQNTRNPENYNIIAATTTNLMLLSGFGVSSVDFIINPDTAPNPTKSDSNITHPSNGIYFQDIIDMVVTEDKDLFVLDGYHKIIFKFDISGITTLDESIWKNDTPGRLMVNLVGDDGDIDDKINFINPLRLVTVNNEIYLLDQHPETMRCVVKVFDSHLNWKQSYNLGVFSDQHAVDMEYNSFFNQFYIVSHTNNSDNLPIITSFTRDFNMIEQHDLLDLKRHDLTVAQETYKRLYFSVVNQNIMYIVTDKNIYKKYVNRPTDFIGRLKFEERYIGTTTQARDLTDLTIFPVTIQQGDITQSKDEILLFEGDWNTIYRFLEDSGFENSLESGIDDKVLPFESIMIKPDENVDIITYNKALYKMLFNNLLLLENLSRKFATFFDDKGLSQYVGFKYLNNDELINLRYNITSDNYISNNEIVLSETINRCLKEIYDLQLTVMGNMSEQSINVYPDPSKIVNLT